MADKASKPAYRQVLILSAFLIGIPLALLFVYLRIRSAEARQWEEMRRWCEDVANEVRARDSRRPVLRGVAEEGNAWDEYRVALNLVGFKVDITPVASFLWHNPEADPAKARAVVERYAAAFEALRRGASRSRAQRRTNWEPQSEKLGSHINYLALLAACRSRFLAEDGRPREAMELLLDTVQYGEDAALNGTWTDGLGAMGQISIAMDELKDLLMPKRMTREGYQELERELALLDQGFPREAEGW